jgi:hypothetical protein
MCRLVEEKTENRTGAVSFSSSSKFYIFVYSLKKDKNLIKNTKKCCRIQLVPVFLVGHGHMAPSVHCQPTTTR